jgi:hypothetical protein
MMRKLYPCIFFLLLLPLHLMSQHEAGSVQLRFGAGLSGFDTSSEVNRLFGITWNTKDTTGMSSAHIPVYLLFGAANRLSLGAYSRFGYFFVEDKDPGPKNDNIFLIGFTSEFYIVNSPVIHLYLGGGIHYSSVTLYETSPLISLEYKYHGWGPVAHLGVNIHPFNFLGLNVKLGYEGHHLILNKFYINDNPQSKDSFNVSTKANGIHFGAGFNIKF